MERRKASEVFVVVANIPPDYHSKDLRNYFSMFVESGGFSCFHFRHRPEGKVQEIDSAARSGSSQQPSSNVDNTDVLSTLSKWGNVKVTVETPKIEKKKRKKTTTCCVVKVWDSRLPELMENYHRSHWLNMDGDSIPSLCQLKLLNVHKMPATNDGDSKYKTRAELKKTPLDREEFTAADLEKLSELHPPDIMPNGNVGTPTCTFLRFIRECRMPPKVIGKLGLKFNRKQNNKIYSHVHFDYGGKIEDVPEPEPEVVKSASGHEVVKEGEIINLPTSSKDKTKRETEKEAESEDEEQQHRGVESDSDDCEDYERHEALHSDVMHHVERNKERLFESEIELKWEKGGSGLVFYTDAQYWDAQKGDFDERTADDWDVDMEIYTDHRAGDKDARDHLSMRQEARRRAGKEDTDMFTCGIGKFEKHSRGFGRRVMKKQGWSEGDGLGSAKNGISEALDNDGQKPFDRSGLGYLGERLDRSVINLPRKRQRHEDVIISTIYDNPEETDPQEPLYRTLDHHHLTWRQNFRYGGIIQGGATEKESTGRSGGSGGK